MRIAEIHRKTNETQIYIKIDLDGTGISDIECPVPFLSHMLELFTRHAGVDLTVEAAGDIEIDDHHTVEDIGIALGSVLRDALSDKAGIARYGNMILPMDESLILCALDLSGRACLNYEVEYRTNRVGSFDIELVEEFFTALVRKSEMTLHIKKLAGTNSHHIAEACFKAFAHALKGAIRYTGEATPLSTKGTL